MPNKLETIKKQTVSLPQPKPKPKKHYETPQLVSYGSVLEITGGVSGPGTDFLGFEEAVTPSPS